MAGRFRTPWVHAARSRTTDYERWSDLSNIHSAWESRTRRAANFVPPHSRVIEFGAATRLIERFMDPSCTYVPSDIVDRGPGTVVCDLNDRPLPELGHYDVAVIMGGLEYINDVPAVLDWLAKDVPRYVVSYACADAKPTSIHARFQSASRLKSGWVNSYSSAEFRSLFIDRGFPCLHEENWKKKGMKQTLFVFSRESGA